MSDDTNEAASAPVEPETEANPGLGSETEAAQGLEVVENPEADGDNIEATEPDARRGIRRFAWPALAVAGVLVLTLAGGAWASLRATTTVPSVTGLLTPQATARILSAELRNAPMSAVASNDFVAGAVVEQNPVLGVEVPVGAPVDLLVAVPPTPTVVPDVSLDTTIVAQQTLGYALLRPVVYGQLSDTVPFGRVVAQMPRAGTAVMTGQQVAVFASLGPGSGGAVVPNVVGKSVADAAKEISGVYLVALLFDVRAGDKVTGKVTDQVPAPGTRVPVGSAVPLTTSGMSN